MAAQLRVLRGGKLEAKDIDSFDHPAFSSTEDWQMLLQKMYEDVEEFAALLQELPDNLLQETFVDEKYGSYYRNLHGVIEHGYYHLGQIVLLKKLLRQNGSDLQQ